MNIDSEICPVCEAGRLSEIRYEDDFNHNGKVVHVDGLMGCECDACGADPILKSQIKYNHLRIADAKRLSEGMLTGMEIKAFRKSFDLTQKQAAALFCGGANAFSKYERGDVIQSRSMDVLIRLISVHRYLIDDLKQHAGMFDSNQAYVSTSLVQKRDTHGSKKQFQKEKVVYIAEWRNVA